MADEYNPRGILKKIINHCFSPGCRSPPLAFLSRKNERKEEAEMLDKKHERYWDNLDIDTEWKEFLDAELVKDKKADGVYYRKTRSANKMTEELMYMFIHDEENENDSCSKRKIKEKVMKIKYAIMCLTDKQRLVVELYFFHGKKQREIAEIMECTQQNVSKRLLCSLKRIAKKLNK